MTNIGSSGQCEELHKLLVGSGGVASEMKRDGEPKAILNIELAVVEI